MQSYTYLQEQVNQVRIDIIIEESPYEMKEQTKSPWIDKLVKANDLDDKLDEAIQQILHTFLVKATFVYKRKEPNVENVVIYLSTRTIESNEGDWLNLVRMSMFLTGTRNDLSTLEADNPQVLNWYTGVSFSVHQDI